MARVGIRLRPRLILDPSLLLRYHAQESRSTRRYRRCVWRPRESRIHTSAARKGEPVMAAGDSEQRPALTRREALLAGASSGLAAALAGPRPAISSIWRASSACDQWRGGRGPRQMGASGQHTYCRPGHYPDSSGPASLSRTPCTAIRNDVPRSPNVAPLRDGASVLRYSAPDQR